MILVYGIVCLALGVFAEPSWLLSLFPALGKANEKRNYNTGRIGFVFGIIGVGAVVHSLLNLSLLSNNMTVWITWLVTALAIATLGFMLAYRYGMRRAENSTEASDLFISFQDTMGTIAIGIGLWQIAAAIIWVL